MPERILNARLAPFTSTIFTEMSALALRTGSVNLGQGFPDTDGPTEVVEAAVAALRGGHNQYPPGPGVPELRAAVADHQRRFYGIDLDPDTEVVVTIGATEGIAASVLGLCEPGDEVIILEPWYDSYAAVHRPGRRHPPGGTRWPPTSPSTPTPWPRPSPPPPAWCCSTPRTTRPAGSSASTSSRPSPGCAWSTTCWRSPTRSTSTWCSRAATSPWPPCPAWPSAPSRSPPTARPSRSRAGRSAGLTGPAPLVAAAHVAKQYLSFHGGTPLQHAAAVALGLPDDFYAGASPTCGPSGT